MTLLPSISRFLEKFTVLTDQIIHTLQISVSNKCCNCRAMKTKGMVFRYTWVYSKEDTMAHTRRLVVTS